MINIRRATEKDASDYAHILNQSWKDTYGEYVSEEHIDDEFNIDKLIKGFKSHIEKTHFELYMIEYNNEVVGITELGAPDPEDLYKDNMEGYGEERTLHIKKEFHDLGIGSYVEEFMLKRLKELGFKKAFAWIKEKNLNSIKFHAKHDFKMTEYRCDNTIDGAPSIVMERDLEEEIKMKSFDEMWEELSPYLTCERGLDEGFADGKYTKTFARYCKHIDGIDVSENFYKEAQENLKDFENVVLRIMGAKDLKYPDKYFDVVLNTSFHEFDLSGDVFTMDFDLKTKMLEEMMRVSDTICFAEIAPENLSGELYKVFNPVEEHSLRIQKSNELIDKVLTKNGYKLVLCDYAIDEIYFNSREEFEEEMLVWWHDVKVPSNEQEKQEMIKKIDDILETKRMLTDLCFHDVFRYAVYKR